MRVSRTARLAAFAGSLLALAVGARASSVTVAARDVHLCINLHDQDGVQAIGVAKRAGFPCYRKDATGAPLERQLASAGLKADLIVSDEPSPTGQLAAVAALAKAYPGSVELVEGRNEINNRPTRYGGFIDTGAFDQSGRSAIRLYMRDLLATVRASPELAKVPVLAHTDLHASDAPADWANAHAYDGATDSWPDYWPAQVAKEMALAMPGKPQALTEFGVKHAERAPYLLPQWVAASLLVGIDRLWLYELRDEPGDPYGLYTADWSPKPAAAIMAKLNALLTDRGRGRGGPPLTVTLADPAVNSVLVARSDGSYLHLLWRSWPDGRAHPLSWTYDKAAQVHVRMLPSSAGVVGIDRAWRQAAGQPATWEAYTDGVLILDVRP